MTKIHKIIYIWVAHSALSWNLKSITKLRKIIRSRTSRCGKW